MSSLEPLELAAAFDELALTENVTYVLSADRRIIRTNAAWERFAAVNGGEQFSARWPSGTSMFDAIPPTLRPFYAAAFTQACRSGVHWEHDYECSSPDVFRRFRMVAYPFGENLIVTHSLLIERPHDRELHEPDESYTRRGVISMCSHCRRVRHAAIDRWDWVPLYVAQMPVNISHGLCGGCMAYYYADLAECASRC